MLRLFFRTSVPRRSNVLPRRDSTASRRTRGMKAIAILARERSKSQKRSWLSTGLRTIVATGLPMRAVGFSSARLYQASRSIVMFAVFPYVRCTRDYSECPGMTTAGADILAGEQLLDFPQILARVVEEYRGRAVAQPIAVISPPRGLPAARSRKLNARLEDAAPEYPANKNSDAAKAIPPWQRMRRL